MEIHEAKSLRWLVNQFPLTLPARHDTDKICNAIHLYAKAGADKLEAQAKRIEELERSQEALCEATVGYSAEIARLDKEVANLTNHIQENPKPQTNADRIRAMVATDEGIAKILMSLDISLAEDGKEFTHLYCDGKNGCITEDDDIICTDEMRTACIVRWLQQPAKEE